MLAHASGKRPKGQHSFMWHRASLGCHPADYPTHVLSTYLLNCIWSVAFLPWKGLKEAYSAFKALILSSRPAHFQNGNGGFRCLHFRPYPRFTGKALRGKFHWFPWGRTFTLTVLYNEELGDFPKPIPKTDPPSPGSFISFLLFALLCPTFD